MNNEPIFVPWDGNENIPTIIPKEITKETRERYYHETPNLYYTKFNINTKEMIKFLELRTPEEVSAKLTKVQNSGWNMGNAFIKIAYVPEVGFYLFYDSKLPIE